MLLQYILWDDWPIFMISASNEQLQQELEYTLLKSYCHSWWISKIQSGREDTLEERYTIKFVLNFEKMEEASTLQISSVAIPPGQCTSPQLRPCHRLFDQDGHQQFLTLTIVQALLPVTFGYSLSSEADVMRQLRRWKRLWRRSLTRSHKRTSMGPSRSCCITAGGDYFEGD